MWLTNFRNRLLVWFWFHSRRPGRHIGLSVVAGFCVWLRLLPPRPGQSTRSLTALLLGAVLAIALLFAFGWLAALLAPFFIVLGHAPAGTILVTALISVIGMAYWTGNAYLRVIA